jgi:hypothetical protein
MIISLLFAVALAADSPATIPVATNQPKTTEASEKKICRSDHSTGSIIPKRVCHTQAEWDQMEAEGHQMLDMVQSQRRSRI